MLRIDQDLTNLLRDMPLVVIEDNLAIVSDDIREFFGRTINRIAVSEGGTLQLYLATEV